MDEIIDSITRLMLMENTRQEEDPGLFFNHWRNQTGIIITDARMAGTALNYIKNALLTNRRVLQKSMEDGYGKTEEDQA